tara:strand:+ start:538 stop:1161 length:624 start_codon:yes stop_codon:yes gene_type:complete
MGLIKYNNLSISSIDDVSGIDDSMVLIKTLTASSSANLSFVNGTSDVVLNSTYPIYKFVYTNIHPGNDSVHFSFNGSDDTSSHSYNITKTSSHFEALLYEGDTGAALQYNTAGDLAQSTGVQSLGRGVGNDNDQATSGELWLFNPSSTTFVKHFMHRDSVAHDGNGNFQNRVAGYFNTTAAITAIQFTFSGGNIDSGTIKLYGIKDS